MSTPHDSHKKEADTGWIITNLDLFIYIVLAWLWPPKE